MDLTQPSTLSMQDHMAEPGTKQHLKTSLIEFCFLAESGHSLEKGDLSCFRPEGELKGFLFLMD
jgi:hypothetical protein